MDLTKQSPRSVSEKLAGLVMLARAVDKARAYKAGTLGEYNYDCGMDNKVFAFLGTTDQAFADRAEQLSDRDIEKWVRESFLAHKSADEIDRYNTEFLERRPEPGTDSEKYFTSMRDSIDRSRTDITTWAQLLDLDEKRDVPQRKAA
ncbi:MAG: DUF5069 domain-containing protein [Candidatus Eremiobacteraeota bacterium]|nr:DUF5069 domain-containing protein [Candidatus Eremiobacteraeota bacterium]